MSDLDIEYEPNGSTASIAAFALTFVSDPAHPVNGSVAYINGGPPTYATVVNGDNFVTFSSWARWRRSFPTDHKTVYYTYGADNSGVENPADFTDTDQRQTCFGALTCLSNTPEIAATFGRLIFNFDIEFSDPSPLVTGNITLPALIKMYEPPSLRRRAHEVKLAPAPSPLRTSDEDVELVSVPKYIPLPSSVPGTSGYVPSHSASAARGWFAPGAAASPATPATQVKKT
jgi:hypothetical protein